ncbi:GtrA family protein [Pseudomonas sp. 10B1]|uniref:GtrA family protein n=1 Tax=unclassified Pseudomonas TaxID=196821 RepID=UPI002AB50330|nr:MULTISPECIES: GtrA family protein [unclassified Pseudomonas]MDY7561654.1 GtrA family protein [Pseudomonas sp. AB6]MEA9994619.1 GtrA family protein [Pseudomonas sp. AA4]MEB0085764.1 GtrA family protein [Pseudomonas sp. RTI1]MEB0125911.1 GtrA family protein [Pseudomonas sp. CCC1.2]MEB0152715.1 GtrA family protein [Pseudomonas sp. CCC4.3]
MKLQEKQFASYVVIGLINTLIHGVVFLTFHVGMGVSQAYSNLCGFAVAVSFSFYANAQYTFNAQKTWSRYLKFVAFMGLLSLGVGYVGDLYLFPPLATWMLFSAISLVCGFLYSKRVIFRESSP